MKKAAILLLALYASAKVNGQGTLSGDIQTNINYYMKDTSILASGNPLYDNYLSGGETWLSLRYNVSGYTFFLRGDAFQNSNLKTPGSPMTDFGIGAWNITKDIDQLSVSIGYIYDQIGSGLLFRSYEDRGLLIDNALIGAEVKYKLQDNISLKAFGGQQKNNNFVSPPARYAPIIKGFNAEGDFSAGKVHLVPGVGFLNRTLDANSMFSVATNINAMDMDKRFLPRYNMYAMTAYNTLTYKNFSWYAEAAYKTHEAFYSLSDELVDKPGNIEFTTISYGRKGIAINVTGKRTENFVMRTSPNEKLLNGMMNWQPIVAVLRPFRLMSRYTPASQDISEMAGIANVVVTANDELSFNGSYTHSNTLEGAALYREVFGNVMFQNATWTLDVGAQYMNYNIERYQSVSGGGIITGLTPYVQATYKFDDKQSVSVDAQYMHMDRDYGSWAFLQFEYAIAPKWSFAVSDMYNIVPYLGPDHRPDARDPGNHFPSIFAAYTKNANRFTLAYVKQVAGMNCTGGVCRYEPAFSGIRATITSSF